MLSARRTLLAVVLLLAAASLSVALLLKHYGVGTPVDAICGSEERSGCDVVNQSAYSKLAGVPLAAIGLVFYVSLAGSLGLTLVAGDAARMATARVVLMALAASLAADLVLLGIQAAKLNAYCVLCLLTYVMGTAAFAAVWPARRAAVMPALAAGEGRLVVAGSLIASLAAIAAVSTYHVALEARPASPLALLGAATPATAAPASPASRPPASPAASPPPAGPPLAQGGDALQRAQQEVQRLQAILDDPQKLEQYFSDKALKEFEQAKAEKLDLAGVPFKGPADAPIKVVEFSDFLCPYCRQLAEGLGAYLPQTSGRVALYYKQYPMDSGCNETLKQQLHEGACLAALGGLCAAEQDRFWPYHDRAFTRQAQQITRQEVLKVGAEAGLDAAAFNACVDRPATAERLRAQIREGTAAGVKGTPSVFMNGRRVTRMNDFVRMIESESARLGLPALPSPPPRRR